MILICGRVRLGKKEGGSFSRESYEIFPLEEQNQALVGGEEYRRGIWAVDMILLL